MDHFFFLSPSSRNFVNSKNCFVVGRAPESVSCVALPRLPACQIAEAAKRLAQTSSYDESTEKRWGVGHVLGGLAQFPLLHRENKSLKKSKRELPSGQSPGFLSVAPNTYRQVSGGLPVLDKGLHQCSVPIC